MSANQFQTLLDKQPRSTCLTAGQAISIMTDKNKREQRSSQMELGLLKLETGTEVPEYGLTVEQLSELMASPTSVDKVHELGGMEQIAVSLKTNLKTGLSSEEQAVAFASRKATYGSNIYPSPPPTSYFKLLWEALTELIMIILLVSAVLSIILGVIPIGQSQDDTGPQWIQGVAILLAVIIECNVAAFNNWSKDRKFRKLDQARNDDKVKVIREGRQIEIDIFDLNVGDIVEIGKGDRIPADGLYVDGFNLSIDESNLTGEVKAVHKNEKTPFIVSGSIVAEGKGRMLITQVGPNSEHGKTIARLKKSQDDTPLQKKLGKLALLIGKVGVSCAIVVFVILVIYWVATDVALTEWEWIKLQRLIEFFIVAVTVVVVSVPEGLPLAVTVSLAYSMKQMLKDKNLVRHLQACETMGGATNICSDKTGTLTENRMTVIEGWIGGVNFNSPKPGTLEYESPINAEIKKKYSYSVSVNSSGVVHEHEGQPDEFIGNKTECALLVFARKLDYSYLKIREEFEGRVVSIMDFSSERKRMSTVVKIDTGYRMFTKGASEIVLKRCTRRFNEDGEVVDMTPDMHEKLNELIETMAGKALRTLCVAYKDVEDEQDWQGSDCEDDLTLIAVVGIEDPLRPPVIDSIKDCVRAGIFVRMVTGDNITTAKKIASDCGILTPGGIAMEGPDFNKLSNEEIDDMLPRLQVLARSTPDDKYKLVHRLRLNGEVVAVTGDGTNDALALKEADVGLAMGIAGTGVAKQASDIVILDDNFVSIVRAVIWGRSVFDNIRKFLQFQLTVNVCALVVAVVGAAANYGTPLKAIQLLWVNLIMDTMAALALCTEKPTPELLNKPPYGRKGKLLTNTIIRNILSQAGYQIAILLAILFEFPELYNTESGQNKAYPTTHYTFLFNTFVFMQIFNEFNARRVNDEKNIFAGVWKNWLFLSIIVGTIAIQAIIVEFGNVVFFTNGLPWELWLISIGLGFLSIPLGYLFRLIPVPQDKNDGSYKSPLMPHSKAKKLKEISIEK